MARPKKARLIDLLRQHWVENPGLTAKHREDFEMKLRSFERHIGHESTTDDLTAELIGGFMMGLKDAGKSAYTVNHHRTVLMLVAGYAERDDIIRRKPRVKRMREPKRVPRGFNSREMVRIVAACSQAPAIPQRMHQQYDQLGSWTGDDWHILIRGVWELGTRPTALFSVRFQDVTNGRLLIRGQFTKTGIETAAQITPTLSALIDQRRIERGALPDDLILIWPCNRRHLWMCLRKHILTPAGIGKETALYGVLKGATSYVARELGLTASMKFRGHTSVTMTLNYVDPRIADKEIPAIEVLPPIDVPPSPANEEGAE